MSLKQTLCEKCQNTSCSQVGKYNTFFTESNICTSFDSGEVEEKESVLEEEITQQLDIPFPWSIPYI